MTPTEEEQEVRDILEHARRLSPADRRRFAELLLESVANDASAGPTGAALAEPVVVFTGTNGTKTS